MSEQIDWNKGWVAIPRDIINHWSWLEFGYTYTPFHAYVDIIMSVNWKDNSFSYKGNVIECKRGQMLYSLRKLASKWGWSTTRVSRFLKNLEEEGKIETEKLHKVSRLTLCEFERYNPAKDRSEMKIETQKKRTEDKLNKERKKQDINKLNCHSNHNGSGDRDNISERIGNTPQRPIEKGDGLNADMELWESTKEQRDLFKLRMATLFGVELLEHECCMFFNMKKDNEKLDAMKHWCMYYQKSWYELLTNGAIPRMRDIMKVKKIVNPSGFLYDGVFGRPPYLLEPD
ncbi:hypothetical protein ACFL6I_08510 [candidate division KSB1 bacterium]